MPDLVSLLAMAGQGWRIFPVRAGQKKPPLVPDWEHAASCDPATIERWHAQNPGCNWAIATGPSGLLVVDIDTKGGKNGRGSLADLEFEHEVLPHTLRITTPTRGEHIYLRGRSASSVQRLGPGLDVRSAGGYVLAPGCQVDGMPYSTLQLAAVAEAPAWLVAKAGVPLDRPAQPQQVVAETEGAVVQALAFLRTAEPSVEGAGGNDNAFRVAVRLRDFGVAEATALTLLLSSWNDRCQPPWNDAELAKIVRNAYAYAKKEAGGSSAELAFADVPVPAASVFEEPAAKKPEINFKVKAAADIAFGEIKPRQWLLGHRFLPNFITLTIAPGGVGKSTLALMECAALVCNKPELLGLNRCDPGPAWYCSTEDPLEEIERRTAALWGFHKLPDECKKDFYISSGREAPILLVKSDGKGSPVIQHNVINAVVETIKARGIKLWVVDPFVRLHSVDENDNMAIDKVAQALTTIAARSGAAVHVVHHTRKRAAGHGGEGDADTARGASALVSAARIAHTLCGMTEKQADTLGLASKDHRFWVRLDDAKANLAPPQDKETWFRKEGHDVAGEKVGVLQWRNMDAVPKVTQVQDDEGEEKPARKPKGRK